MPIIILSGKIGSGKTTASYILREKLGLKYWETRAFADTVRQCAAPLTGYEPHHMKMQDIKNKKLTSIECTVGEVLQAMGEGMRDRLGENVWLNILLSQYDKSKSYWIIEDARYANEIESCRNLTKCVVIRLEGDPGKVREVSTRNMNSTSEIALDNYQNFDYVIKNDTADIENLTYQLAAILRSEKLF